MPCGCSAPEQNVLSCLIKKELFAKNEEFFYVQSNLFRAAVFQAFERADLDFAGSRFGRNVAEFTFFEGIFDVLLGFFGRNSFLFDLQKTRQNKNADAFRSDTFANFISQRIQNAGNVFLGQTRGFCNVVLDLGFRQRLDDNGAFSAFLAMVHSLLGINLKKRTAKVSYLCFESPPQNIQGL